MILVTKIRHWTRPELREQELVAWGPEATAARLAPPWFDLDGAYCLRNGGELAEADRDRVLADGDHLIFGVIPGGPLAVPAVTKFLFFFAASYALQQILMPSRPTSTKADEGAYGYTGLSENSRALGRAWGVVYGEHRVAGPMINRYVRISLDENGMPRTELLLLMHISEGPIQSIGGKTEDGGPFSVSLNDLDFMELLEIDGQPAKNYEGIEAWVRMGDIDQEPIEGFAEPVKQHVVDAELLGPEVLTAIAETGTVTPTTTNAIASAGAPFPPADPNITKWTNEPSLVGFTTPDPADEFTVVVRFPQGLSNFSGASPVVNYARFQIRYREVDTFGTPIGDYLVLPIEPTVALNRQGEFLVEYRHKFFSPASYTPPIPGFYLQHGTVNNGASYVLDPAKLPLPPASELELSFAFWVKAPTTLNTNSRRLFRWTNAAAFQGFRLQIDLIDTGEGDARLRFEWGNGTAFVSTAATEKPYWYTSMVSEPAQNWHLVVVTYKANASGTNHRVRYFLDGALKIDTLVAGAPAVLDPTQAIRVGGDGAGVLPYNGPFDEFTVWQKELSPYDVSQIWNLGEPLATPADSPHVAVGFRMDNEQVFSGRRYSDAFGFAKRNAGLASAGDGLDLGASPKIANDPQCSLIAGAGNLGIVKAPEVGTPKAGRYLIEMLRLNAEDGDFRKPDKAQWLWTQLRTFQPYAYGGQALLAVRIPTSEQLSSGEPTVSQVVQGKKVLVWDGIDPVSPNLVLQYSRSPAWIAVDMATNEKYGGGAFYKIIGQVDLPGVDLFDSHCGQYIYDNGPTSALVTVREFAAGSHNIPFDHVEWEVSSLPSNFPGVTGIDKEYPQELRITSDVPGGSPPAWFTTHRNAGASEIVQVEYNSTSARFFVRARHNGTFASGAAHSPAGVKCQVHDVRYRLDVIFDEHQAKLWDLIVQVLQTARAVPIRVGRRFSIFFDDIAQPVALVGMGQIVPGSFKNSFIDVRGRPNRMMCEYRDEALNYRMVPAQLQHPTVNDPSGGVLFVDKPIQLRGVTRRGQVMRHMMRDLNSYYLLRQAFEWEQGMDALVYQPGQLIALAHDVAGFGASGRVWGDSSSDTTVKLDRPVVLEVGKTYQVHVHSVASGARETRTVSSPAGSYAAGATLTVAAFSFSPDKNDVYSIGEVAKGDSKLVRLLNCKRIPGKRRVHLRALEHNPDVYSDDFGEMPEVLTTNLPAPVVPPVPPGVNNLVATEVPVREPDGSSRIALEVSFTHWPETYSAVARTNVFVSEGGSEVGFGRGQLVATLDARTTSARIDSFHFERDRKYTVWIQPETNDGRSRYRSFFSYAEFTPSGLAPHPPALVGFRGSVVGESAVYEWDDSSEIDYGATVEARRGVGWIFAMPVFAAAAQARRSPGTNNWLSAPENSHGVGAPDIIVRVKLRTGQYGSATRLSGKQFAPVSDGGRVLGISIEDTNWNG